MSNTLANPTAITVAVMLLEPLLWFVRAPKPFAYCFDNHQWAKRPDRTVLSRDPLISQRTMSKLVYMTKRLPLFLLLALIATACSALPGGAVEPTSSQSDIDGSAPDVLANAKPTDLDDPGDQPAEAEYDGPDSTYLFDQAELHTFELTLDPDDLAWIDSDPRDEEYVPATLSFEGAEVGEVGLRYKGSIGAFIGCLADIDAETDQPMGPKTCTKLSMKIKVNWDGSSARFYDLRKLQLHSQNRDQTQMHERLGYWLFGEMGVPAPRSVHARVVINGEFIGLFALTEQVDGRFARHHFDDGTGNVFKERWPTNTAGLAVHEAELASGLKTNEEEDAAPLLRAFGEALEAASSDDELRDVIETYLDVEETMSLLAVDRAIANDDGPLHFYCFDDCSNHNLYWYANPTTQKLHLIPWDLDNAFENIVTEVNPVNPIADPWDQTSNNCEIFSYGEAGFPQRSAACDPVFAGLALFQDEYLAAQQRLLDGPFAEGVIEAQLAIWAAQIEQATVDASGAHVDAVTVEEWHAALADLEASIVFARAELKAAVAVNE